METTPNVQETEERVAKEGWDKNQKSRIRGALTDGFAVFRWPEFIAFANRLGIDLNSPTIGVEIRIFVDEVVRITETYHGDDFVKKPLVMDTTTVHNEKYRTKVPVDHSGVSALKDVAKQVEAIRDWAEEEPRKFDPDDLPVELRFRDEETNEIGIPKLHRESPLVAPEVKGAGSSGPAENHPVLCGSCGGMKPTKLSPCPNCSGGD